MIKSRRDSKMLQKVYGPTKSHFKREWELWWERECRPNWSVFNIRLKQLNLIWQEGEWM